MNKQIVNNRALDKYLLGSLSAAETERLDELSVTDDDFADALAAAEKDLVDAYVQGELSGAALAQFKSHYLASPRRRENIEFARGLEAFAKKEAAAAAINATPHAATKSKVDGWSAISDFFARTRLPWRWSFALAALLLLLVAGSWLWFENRSLRQQMSQTEAQRAALGQREQELQKEIAEQRSTGAVTEQEIARAREERERLTQELNKIQEQRRLIEAQSATKRAHSSSPNAVNIASFVLTPQMRGTGQLPVFSLPPQIDRVAMQLNLEPDDHYAYNVALLDRSHDQILWRSGRLKASAKGDGEILNISFRADLLRRQNYVLRVSGIAANGASEIINDYPFGVVK